MSAADQYKETIAAITAGLTADVERNSERLAVLRTEVPERQHELSVAADRRQLVRIAAELSWEDALEVLWTQTKVTMRPFPKPSRFVKDPGDGAAVLALAAEVEERAATLREVVQGRKRS
jgi:hypothetical protein